MRATHEWIAAALVLGLGLAGCGDGDGANAARQQLACPWDPGFGTQYCSQGDWWLEFSVHDATATSMSVDIARDGGSRSVNLPTRIALSGGYYKFTGSPGSATPAGTSMRLRVSQAADAGGKVAASGWFPYRQATPMVDCGADAGPVDAGPPDAGPPDAGPVDAGPPDAGPRDAGPLDAGPIDAGPVDAGADAGLPGFDAGTSDGGPLVRTGRMVIPYYGELQPATSWVDGTKLVGRDCTLGSAGDLFTLLFFNNTLVAYTSKDQGSTWTYVGAAVPGGHAIPKTMSQDASGAVHLVTSWGSYGRLEYSRVALNHDATGHVIGLTSVVSGQAIGSLPIGSSVQLELITGRDTSGNALLFLAVLDDPYTTTRARLRMLRTSSTAGVAPRAGHPEDWVALNGSAGATTVAVNDSRFESFTSYAMTVGLAQHPRSLDLHLFAGTRELGDNLSPTPGIRRFRFVPAAGPSWAQTGAAVMLTSDLGRLTPTWGSAISGPRDVWYALFDEAHGIIVGRIDASGLEVPTGIPSPDPFNDMNGWLTLSVDSTESRVWMIWLRQDLDVYPSPFRTFSGYWNGAQWDVVELTATGPYIYPLGIAGTVGWLNGLVTILPEDNANGGQPPHKPSLIVIHGGP